MLVSFLLNLFLHCDGFLRKTFRGYWICIERWIGVERFSRGDVRVHRTLRTIYRRFVWIWSKWWSFVIGVVFLLWEKFNGGNRSIFYPSWPSIAFNRRAALISNCIPFALGLTSCGNPIKIWRNIITIPKTQRILFTIGRPGFSRRVGHPALIHAHLRRLLLLALIDDVIDEVPFLVGAGRAQSIVIALVNGKVVRD